MKLTQSLASIIGLINLHKPLVLPSMVVMVRVASSSTATPSITDTHTLTEPASSLTGKYILENPTLTTAPIAIKAEYVFY